MNKLKSITRYTLYTLLVSVFFSCKNEKQNNKELELYISKYATISIVKVRNCEYVLWHNGYGSDMEHYEGCKNTEHFN